MNIFLNNRQKAVIGMSALVVLGSIAFVFVAPGQTNVAPPVVSPTVPVPTETTPAVVQPSASPTSDATEEYKRIEDVKARAAIDMAMALVAQSAGIDYRQTPEQVIQALRPMTSATVLSGIADRLQALNWDDIKKRQYWLLAEVVLAEPLARAESTTGVPSKVRVTVDLFEVSTSQDLKPVGRQIWEVGVGQGDGPGGWLATSLEEIG